jgi:nocturnin
LSFNVLADGLAEDGGFKYASQSDLRWNQRFPMMLEEIKRSCAHIVCLAECNHFQEDWVPAMKELGFEGVYSLKDRPETQVQYGVAIFYKSERFSLQKNEPYGINPVQLLTRLEEISTKKTFLVSMFHLKAKEPYFNERSSQVLSALRRLATTELVDHRILCGDFNAEPTEHCIQMFSDQKDIEMAEPLPWTTWKVREIPVKHTIDYVFYSSNMKVHSSWLPPHNVHPVKALPCVNYPSDHIGVAVNFII